MSAMVLDKKIVFYILCPRTYYYYFVGEVCIKQVALLILSVLEVALGDGDPDLQQTTCLCKHDIRKLYFSLHSC